MSELFKLKPCEECNETGDAHHQGHYYDCPDCLGTGYEEPAKRIMNLELMLNQHKETLKSGDVYNNELAQKFEITLEQRDEWKAKYIQQNKDLGHELRDSNETIWSECALANVRLTHKHNPERTMNTDTPTTNARWETLCCSGQSWYQIAEEMKLDCRQLERELTAARAEQRETGAAESKCLTKGCENHRHQGKFIGDLCAPCNSYITTGNVGPTESFIGDLQRERDEARKLAERYRNLSCDSQEEADETLLPWENNQTNEP